MALVVSTGKKRPPPLEHHHDESQSPAKKLQQSYEVHWLSLMDRIRTLFPKQDVLSIPCKSARLFACFTLMEELRSKSVDLEKRESRSSSAAKHVKPILSLLWAMVEVERTSLGQDVSKKTVQFSGFDCSSTLPAVDSLWGSHDHWEASIEALAHAVDQVQVLLSSTENKVEVMRCLQSLASFLRTMESDAGESMRYECARTMPSKENEQWPSDRFVQAARSYREDFERIINDIQSEPLQRSSPLLVESRLAEFLGQSIRFYLRTFFNPVPWKVGPGQDQESTAASKVSKIQSRIGKMISMSLPANVVAKDTAVADGAVSSVFSMALRVIYDYFGSDVLLSDEYSAPLLPNGFCQSAATQRGRGTRRHPITPDDLIAILSDIREAQRFLDAAHACQFLSDLIGLPGIQDEIRRVGGWMMVERHANKLLEFEFDLFKWCPGDVHLVVLSDTGRFFQRVQSYRMAMERLVHACEQSLLDLQVRFKVGPKNEPRKTVYVTIKSVLEEERSRFVFPAVELTPG